MKKKQKKYDHFPIGNLPHEDLKNLHVLNTELLSAIYNDSQLRKEEQTNFMNIITQLSCVVKELKDQNNLKDIVTQPVGKVIDKPSSLIDHQYGKPLSPRNNTRKTLAEREYDNSPVQIKLKNLHNVTSDCAQVFKTSRSTDSNNSSLPNTPHSSISPYCKNFDNRVKLTRENNKRVPKQLRNKIIRDRFSHMSLKLKKQEKSLAKTRVTLKQFQKQGKSIMSKIEDVKHELEKEKLVIESLLNKSDKTVKNRERDLIQSTVIKELDDRISRIEFRLLENNNQLISQEKEISNLNDELKQANLLKEEYQNKNIQLNSEISDLSTRLALNNKQIDELKDAIRKEKALNDSMKHAYEINLRNVVGNAVQEQRHIVQEMKMSFDNSIATLQIENSELKAKICQLEEDSKKICNDSKIRVVKAKKQLYSQVSIASQKLLKADSKIKEFYYAIEKLMKGIYHRLYEAELEQIKKKCHEEGGVQAASYILGVSATQMSRVLAAGAIPNIHDWIECCKHLIYKEKFAEDLAGFILSLFWPILPKDFARGN